MTARKHVFKDLRPYVCTSERCLKAAQLFECRNDWYDHEVQFHRREWYCDDCEESFCAQGDFKDHLKTDHENLFSNSKFTAAINRCEKASFDDQPCPICQGLQKYSYTRLRSHLARHMQQLALFTLPSLIGETTKEVESNGTQPSEGMEDNSVDLSEYFNLSFDSNPYPSSEGGWDPLKRDGTQVEFISAQHSADMEEDPTKRDETQVLGGYHGGVMTGHSTALSVGRTQHPGAAAPLGYGRDTDSAEGNEDGSRGDCAR